MLCRASDGRQGLSPPMQQQVRRSVPATASRPGRRPWRQPFQAPGVCRLGQQQRQQRQRQCRQHGPVCPSASASAAASPAFEVSRGAGSCEMMSARCGAHGYQQSYQQPRNAALPQYVMLRCNPNCCCNNTGHIRAHADMKMPCREGTAGSSCQWASALRRSAMPFGSSYGRTPSAGPSWVHQPSLPGHCSRIST